MPRGIHMSAGGFPKLRARTTLYGTNRLYTAMRHGARYCDKERGGRNRDQEIGTGRLGCHHLGLAGNHHRVRGGCIGGVGLRDDLRRRRRPGGGVGVCGDHRRLRHHRRRGGDIGDGGRGGVDHGLGHHHRRGIRVHGVAGIDVVGFIVACRRGQRAAEKAEVRTVMAVVMVTHLSSVAPRRKCHGN